MITSPTSFNPFAFLSFIENVFVNLIPAVLLSNVSVGSSTIFPSVSSLSSEVSVTIPDIPPGVVNDPIKSTLFNSFPVWFNMSWDSVRVVV